VTWLPKMSKVTIERKIFFLGDRGRLKRNTETYERRLTDVIK